MAMMNKMQKTWWIYLEIIPSFFWAPFRVGLARLFGGVKPKEKSSLNPMSPMWFKKIIVQFPLFPMCSMWFKKTSEQFPLFPMCSMWFEKTSEQFPLFPMCSMWFEKINEHIPLIPNCSLWFRKSIQLQLILFFLVNGSSLLNAQDQDTQGWFGLEVNKEITKKFIATIGTQRRYETNVSTFFGAYHSVQLKYEPIKNLFIRPSLRLAAKTDGDVWRYGLEVYKRFRKDKYSFDLSQQVYRNFTSWGGDNDPDDDIYEWRSELSNKYRFTKKLAITAGGTLFTEFINDPLDITRLRLRAEASYDVTKFANLAVGLIRQYDYKKNNSIKRELWIPRVDLSINF
jgi:hypothetical protein